jgi:tripartite-type tricarboxylate transporter receptor subunit TctC
MADPEVVERMKEFSAEIVASTPEALAEHVAAEAAKWGPVVEAANVRVE